MRKHNIFTLGIILTTIIMPVYAYRSRNATSIWTDSGHNTLAKEICSDNCAENSCWLPSGTYYDNKGTFTEDCGGGSFLSCPSGQYNIGVGSCVGPTTNGTSYGFWDFGGSKSNTDLYDLKESGTWGVTFPYGVVKGIASCNETSGTKNVATDAEFDQSSTGKSCWCKMTSPAASRWVFDGDFAGLDACVSKCAQDCSSRIRLSPNLRPGVYGSVAQESFFDQTYARGVVDCVAGCPTGYYINGSSCTYCNPASFASIDSQTENITHGSRSRSKSCTSVNTSGGTSCACVTYDWSGWTYSCDYSYQRSGDACVCQYGSFNIGFSSAVDACEDELDHDYWNFDESSKPQYNSDSLTAPGQWRLIFSYGTIKGIASCNDTSFRYRLPEATNAEFSSTVTGRYCWCKMTSPVSLWVNIDRWTSAEQCGELCAYTCAIYAEDRAVLYGSVR